MNDLKLSPRLNAIATLAAVGKRIADIGTDHGYIPVRLALLGHAESITATDIKMGPLSHAMQSAREYGVSDLIRFVCCDGLSFSGAHDLDTVIIAGMGGETIVSILERADWTRSGVRLLLQPQTKTDELCVWLAEAGYELSGAALVEDAGRIYVVLSAVGTGGTHAAVFAEDVLLSDRDDLLPRWLGWRIDVLKKSAEGLSKAKDPAAAALIRETICRLEDTREETRKWQR